MNTLNQNELDKFCTDLKKIKYKNILQDLKLEICSENNQDYLKLILIKIKKSQRKRGYGSAILSEIIKIADLHQIRIVLWTTDVLGSEIHRLQTFYRRHGFILIKDWNDGNMVYAPKIRKN
jgi:GNAT superfamily N-acetyltransferase